MFAPLTGVGVASGESIRCLMRLAVTIPARWEASGVTSITELTERLEGWNERGLMFRVLS